MIYWGRRKTDHWVEPTDCNKFVVWDALWPSPAPAIDTTSQLRHRCSGFVWARHALIEPSVEGHKAVERKRLPLSPFARGSCPPFPRNPGSCEELPGFLSCIRPSRRTAIETLGRRPTVRNAQRRQLASHGNAFPTVPRAILVRMDIKTRNIPRPPRMRQRRSPPPFPRPSWGALPRRHRAACTWATCSAASARGFRPAAKAAASCCASRTWTIAVSARNLPLN